MAGFFKRTGGKEGNIDHREMKVEGLDYGRGQLFHAGVGYVDGFEGSPPPHFSL